jgi:KDO2-lipid IV(A) lauroyltransferase
VVTSLFRFFGALAGRLRWSRLRSVGAIVGWIAGSVLRVRRSHVEQSIRAAGLEGPGRVATEMYRALGTSAVEFLWLSADRGSAASHARFADGSLGLWNDAMAAGRGVVLAASHTGNWDLAACAVAARAPLLVVTKRLSAAGIDRFWQETRERRGVTLSPGEGAMGRASAALRAGGVVAMMIDQVPGSAHGTLTAAFLGRDALVDRAPAVLAARMRAPLLVAAARRDEDGEHVLHVLEVFEPPPRPDADWIAYATVGATRALEDFVRAYPSQWLWLHRRWNPPRVARAAARTMLTPP